MCIHQQKEVIIEQRLAALIVFFESRPGEKNTETARVLLLPLLVSHLAAVGREPENVFNACAANGSSLKETAAPKRWVILAQRDYPPREIEQVSVCRRQLPVDPTDLVILAISIVVTVLRMAEFVSAK